MTMVVGCLRNRSNEEMSDDRLVIFDYSEALLYSASCAIAGAPLLEYMQMYGNFMPKFAHLSGGAFSEQLDYYYYS